MSARKSDLTRLIERTLGTNDVQALLTGKPRLLRPAPDTYPFRTETAEKVWSQASQMMGEFPELDNQQLLLLAIEKSGIYALDISAEDWRLLEMAVEAARGTQRWLPNPAVFGVADYGTELPKNVESASRGVEIRPRDWKAANDVPSSWTRAGHVYRGMTEAEYRAHMRAGYIQSTGAYSHASEGTNFAADAGVG